MGLTKEEQKQLIELSAKAEGMPKKEFIAALAKEHGIDIATPTRQDANTRFLDTILKAGSEGKLNMKEMMDSMMSFKMMEMMMGGSMSGKAETTPAPTGQPNIMEALAKNDEKWERRLEKMEKEQKETALQKQLDDLKALIQNSSGTKKDELSDKFEKLNEKLDAEKEKRFEIALEGKSNEIDQLKEFMQQSLDDLKTRNDIPAKDPTEAFFEMMQKMETFDNTVRRRGKALGMSDEQVDREISSTKPAWQQMLADITGEKGLLAKYIGMQKGRVVESQPEIAQPEAAQAAPITCGNCHGASNNGTDWCDPCRIQYSNDVVAEQQRKAAEAAQKAPTQQTEAEARAKGEIPTDTTQAAEEAQAV